MWMVGPSNGAADEPPAGGRLRADALLDEPLRSLHSLAARPSGRTVSHLTAPAQIPSIGLGQARRAVSSPRALPEYPFPNSSSEVAAG
jgi:hypothetical protein